MCPLHYKLDQVMASAENAFRETTIAMLIADPNRPSPLVESIPTTPASGLVSARIIRRATAASTAS
jgi:hypothetical protein